MNGRNAATLAINDPRRLRHIAHQFAVPPFMERGEYSVVKKGSGNTEYEHSSPPTKTDGRCSTTIAGGGSSAGAAGGNANAPARRSSGSLSSACATLLAVKRPWSASGSCGSVIEAIMNQPADQQSEKSTQSSLSKRTSRLASGFTRLPEMTLGTRLFSGWRISRVCGCWMA